MIYLDNSATTPLDPHVAEAMQPYLGERFGNASSIYSLGREAHLALEDSRSTVASAIGADPSEIIFTSSGTEANNHAIKGVIFSRLKSGTTAGELSMVTSPLEHHAVLEPAAFLESLGVKIHRIAATKDGRIDPASIDFQNAKNVTLASFMLVNNEVGSINDLSAIGQAIRINSPTTVLHCDAVQALGKIDINVRELDVELLSISGHKIHAPKGIGALFIKRGIKIEPLHHGGAQERNRRGGTENVALAVGFAEAVRQMQLSAARSKAHLRALHEYSFAKLSALPEIIFNSPTDETGVDGIINISFVPDVLSRLDGEALLIQFDLEGIALSNGSACTSGSIQPSHVLLAMGKGTEIASKSLRISFSRFTDTQAIDKFIELLRKIIGA
ncbi:MAG: cysteine desulfurase family protein [Ignavibacteriota bacterium]